MSENSVVPFQSANGFNYTDIVAVAVLLDKMSRYTQSPSASGGVIIGERPRFEISQQECDEFKVKFFGKRDENGAKAKPATIKAEYKKFIDAYADALNTCDRSRYRKNETMIEAARVLFKHCVCAEVEELKDLAKITEDNGLLRSCKNHKVIDDQDVFEKTLLFTAMIKAVEEAWWQNRVTQEHGRVARTILKSSPH